MRPVCFVTTIDSQAQFIDWCHNFNQHFRYNSANMRFWCFPYNYCDRSNWNDVSEESRLFFNINDHVDIDHVREESSTQEDNELNSIILMIQIQNVMNSSSMMFFNNATFY